MNNLNYQVKQLHASNLIRRASRVKLALPLVLMALALALPFGSSAQTLSKNVTLQWFGKGPKKFKAEKIDMLVLDGDKLYFDLTRPSGYGRIPVTTYHHIYEYDSKKDDIRILDLTPENNWDEVKFLTNNDGKVVAYISHVERDSKKYQLYAHRVDLDDMAFKGAGKLVAEIDYSAWNILYKGSFTPVTSNDGSKTLLYHKLPMNDRENEEFGFTVLDENQDIMKHQNVVLPYVDKEFIIERMQIDGDGNTYILGKKFLEDIKDKDIPDYQFILLKYPIVGDETIEKVVTVEDHFVTHVVLDFDKDQNPIFTGFYGDRRGQGIAGHYFQKFDKNTGNVLLSTFEPFKADFLAQGLSERKGEKVADRLEKGKNEELFNFKFRNLIKRDDGGYYLIAEVFFVETRSRSSSSGFQNTYYVYHYNEIIVLSLNASGNLEWAKKILKEQHSSLGWYLSFVVVYKNNKLYFIYNENPENLKLKETQKVEPLIVIKGEPFLVTMDAKGDIKKEIIYSQKGAKVILRPTWSRVTDQNSVVLFTNKGWSKYRFGHLTIKN